MFLGHFALAFGAKRTAPAISLGTLFLACQLADLVWPNLVLLGVERLSIVPGLTPVTPLDFESYPYSHSLIAVAGWAAVAAIAYAALRRRSIRAMAVVAGLVVSHWLLDVIAHRPDLPVTIGGPTRLGLGLWYSKVATAAVETALLAGGLLLYVRTTRPLDRVGRYGLVGLVTLLAIISVANLTAPAPPSVNAVVWSAQAVWLFVFWAYWVDKHRTA